MNEGSGGWTDRGPTAARPDRRIIVGTRRCAPAEDERVLEGCANRVEQSPIRLRGTTSLLAANISHHCRLVTVQCDPLGGSTNVPGLPTAPSIHGGDPCPRFRCAGGAKFASHLVLLPGLPQSYSVVWVVLLMTNVSNAVRDTVDAGSK